MRKALYDAMAYTEILLVLALGILLLTGFRDACIFSSMAFIMLVILFGLAFFGPSGIEDESE